MIYKSGDNNFKWAWLDLIGNDPVHPQLPVYKRIIGDRSVFVFIDNEKPQFIISAKISNYLPKSMADILCDNKDVEGDELYATFYSIFRVAGSTMKGGGGAAIKELIDYCKMRNIENQYTLSPIPFLRRNYEEKPTNTEIKSFLIEKDIDPVARFHLGNGACVEHINNNADKSEIREAESWGIMVNYNYTKKEI
jgi:hypothetical protein